MRLESRHRHVPDRGIKSFEVARVVPRPRARVVQMANFLPLITTSPISALHDKNHAAFHAGPFVLLSSLPIGVTGPRTDFLTRDGVVVEPGSIALVVAGEWVTPMRGCVGEVEAQIVVCCLVGELEDTPLLPAHLVQSRKVELGGERNALMLWSNVLSSKASAVG